MARIRQCSRDQASGIRLRGTNVPRKMAKNIAFLNLFHHSNFFYPFAKKFFLKIYLWNTEHRPSKCYYCCIPTLLDDFFVPKLFQRLEQITKYPIKATFFEILKKYKKVKKVTIDVKLFNNTNDYLQF